MKAATAPPLSSSCAAATSGGRGVCGGAGAVEAATRRWEDSARWGGSEARLSPPTAGRGGAQAPRLRDRALLEAPPAPPRRGPLAEPPRLPGRLPGPRPPPPSPALRGLPQSQAAEQRGAPRPLVAVRSHRRRPPSLCSGPSLRPPAHPTSSSGAPRA
ncbi:wiskott-Aldrich syndrome protein homolog [Mustela erminea]|uniref:wiskott-Aldrich syndrome protein homolog n=1 Tax=Mustela erminea TaxID=36723 RepID=UPI00138749F0|nr:wiskott-Aldrich syndrome protein homolog [Mustela erminea]